ncbi:RteC protein [Bacteroidales bacterium Barb7]|nr:RteC protein [Bacteroidales bacterium Barb7]
MKAFFDKTMQSVHEELQYVDMDGYVITLQDALKMVEFLRNHLLELRTFFLEKESIEIQDEIIFFKEMKPQILSLLLYFNKIHSIELKRPNGSNDIQREYYLKEQYSLTYFFERNIDFYQYYRSNSIRLDEYYFVRNRVCPSLCVDSQQFILDPLFSTGYDYKVAKILANEMLRIYLNKQLLHLDKKCLLQHNQTDNEKQPLKWTASKAAAIELGYSLQTSGVFSNGNADIRDIMTMIENNFGIDLGDYYRTYIALKSRKKERAPFLKMLIDNLIKRMDEDDTI